MRYSRDSGSFTPRDVTYLRGTPGQRGMNGGASCDSTVRTPGTPLRNLAPTAAELVARDIASILIVPAVILIVWWAAGSGFVVSVPVEVEHDDGPSSEVGP
jgi:hypothetical protein